MNTVLISGGDIDSDFALDFLKKHPADCLIAIDRGLEFCYSHKMMPDYILGDFDSISSDIIGFYRKNDRSVIQEFNPQKDFTDTQTGVELACRLKSDHIWILGATGGRLDHFWGNVQTLGLCARQNIPAVILDAQNYITLLSGRTVLRKEQQFGKYISFFPFGEKVEHFTLKGFAYPLSDDTIENVGALTVSNEIVDETAVVSFEEGMVIMMMTRDRQK